jgi:hypothetical protein
MTYEEPGEILSVIPKAAKVAKELQLRPNSYAHMVLQFMMAFDQPPRKLGDLVPEQDFMLARRLIVEEQKEFWIGFGKFELSQSYENLQEMVDGACDLIYVVLWAMLKFNVPIDNCFEAVQFSNMSKLNADGTCTKNPETGKIMKPAHYVPADSLLREILMKHFDTAVWDGNQNIRIGDRV